MSTVFKHLNTDWNAQPGSTSTRVTVHDHEVVLAFYMNSFQFPEFREDDIGYLHFSNPWRYRVGTVSDEDFYRGVCRFSKLAPAWGEFYEVSGDLLLKKCPDDWVEVGKPSAAQKHYIFYFRDEEIEVDAESWMLQVYNERREIIVERKI